MKHVRSEQLEAIGSAQFPRAAPGWDAPVGEAPLAFFDFEMTGLDPERDRIVEVGIVRVESGQIVDDLDSLIDPGVPVQPEAAAIHHIDPLAIRVAPRFERIAPRLRALFAGAIPVGHGTELDAFFLARALERVDSEPSPIAHRLDTLTLARRSLHAPCYALPALTARLDLPSRRWHRAHDDALAVRSLFENLVPAFGATTPSDLWQVHIGRREPVVVRSAIAKTLEGFVQRGSFCELTLRAPGKKPFALVARIEHLDVPHVRCVDVRGRVRVLRADRILRIGPTVQR